MDIRLGDPTSWDPFRSKGENSNSLGKNWVGDHCFLDC